MTSATHERLFGYQRAFDHPVTTMLVLAIVAALVAAPLLFGALQLVGRIGPSQQQELWKRYRSWLVLILVMLGPVLLGAAWTIFFVFVLSLLCFREFARATGLFREKVISLVVVLGIFALYFAVLDHWYDLFVALFPLTIGAIALATIGADRPRGFIQRVALGVLGYALFGSGLAHLGYMANDTHYRPQIILMLLAVEANDVFAYTCGKAFGRRKLAPHTSPNKTVAGALGALVLTTLLVALLGPSVYQGTPLENPVFLAFLGVIISVLGQMGDLMLSSVKRDLGLKDLGATIPGHGGVLDRFDSLILVAPAVFHYVGFFIGFGLDQPVRILTRG